ncbi:MAG: hypothetical protein ACR2JR_00155 [Rubrobacteraceae bacterium]
MLAPRTKASFLIVVLAVNLALAGGPGARSAYACSCAGGTSLEEEFGFADAVFVGEASKTRLADPYPEDDADFGGVGFTVSESWKGVSGNFVEVHGQGPLFGTSATFSCHYQFERGEEYLVFAGRDAGYLVTSSCGRTAEISEAEDALEALGAPEAFLPDTGGPGAGSRTGAAVTVSALLALAGVLFLRRKIRQTR